MENFNITFKILNVVCSWYIVCVEGKSMKIDNAMSEQAVLNELSVRFKQTRIDSSITREELADKAMVSVGTIARFESGNDISLKNVIKLMRALDLGDRFEGFIPDVFDRPSYHIENTMIRKRAGKSRKKNDWKWGDEK